MLGCEVRFVVNGRHGQAFLLSDILNQAYSDEEFNGRIEGGWFLWRYGGRVAFHFRIMSRNGVIRIEDHLRSNYLDSFTRNWDSFQPTQLHVYNSPGSPLGDEFVP